jgi:hypothetical protein
MGWPTRMPEDLEVEAAAPADEEDEASYVFLALLNVENNLRLALADPQQYQHLHQQDLVKQQPAQPHHPPARA